MGQRICHIASDYTPCHASTKECKVYGDLRPLHPAQISIHAPRALDEFGVTRREDKGTDLRHLSTEARFSKQETRNEGTVREGKKVARPGWQRKDRRRNRDRSKMSENGVSIYRLYGPKKAASGGASGAWCFGPLESLMQVRPDGETL